MTPFTSLEQNVPQHELPVLGELLVLLGEPHVRSTLRGFPAAAELIPSTSQSSGGVPRPELFIGKPRPNTWFFTLATSSSNIYIYIYIQYNDPRSLQSSQIQRSSAPRDRTRPRPVQLVQIGRRLFRQLSSSIDRALRQRRNDLETSYPELNYP